jgi:hypothetical protein
MTAYSSKCTESGSDLGTWGLPGKGTGPDNERRSSVTITIEFIQRRASAVRGELLDLVGALGTMRFPADSGADGIVDDLLVLSNRLGQISERLRTKPDVAVR